MAKSVLVVTNVFPPDIVGGAELVAHRQAAMMAADGFVVSVFTACFQPADTAPAAPISDIVDGMKVTRIGIPAVTLDRCHKRPEVEAEFAKVLRESMPDIVHFHNLPQLSAGLIPIARAAGARTVVTLHDSWGFCLRQTQLRDGPTLCDDARYCDLCMATVPDFLGDALPVRLRRDYVRWCLEQADQKLFPSKSLLNSYVIAGFAPERCTHLSNGVHLARFTPRRRDPHGYVNFLCIGTLNDHKGSRPLWDALERLLVDPSLNGKWSMVIAGRGPLEAELQARFAAGRLRAPVEYVGFIAPPDVPQAYDRADAVVLASICPEGQGLVLLEAMASGAAQIGSDIGGIPELIEDGASGFVCAPDNVDALESAMRKLILDPELVRRFSVRNLERRAQFDDAHTISRLAAILGDHIAAPESALRPVVLCWGAPGSIAKDGAISCQMRYLDDRLRLLWHEWVDSSVTPDLLCVFGEELPAGALARLVLLKAPLIVPQGLLDLVPAPWRNLAHGYDSDTEALELMARLAAPHMSR